MKSVIKAVLLLCLAFIFVPIFMSFVLAGVLALRQAQTLIAAIMLFPVIVVCIIIGCK